MMRGPIADRDHLEGLGKEKILETIVVKSDHSESPVGNEKSSGLQ